LWAQTIPPIGKEDYTRRYSSNYTGTVSLTFLGQIFATLRTETALNDYPAGTPVATEPYISLTSLAPNVATLVTDEATLRQYGWPAGVTTNPMVVNGSCRVIGTGFGNQARCDYRVLFRFVQSITTPQVKARYKQGETETEFEIPPITLGGDRIWLFTWSTAVNLHKTCKENDRGYMVYVSSISGAETSSPKQDLKLAQCNEPPKPKQYCEEQDLWVKGALVLDYQYTEPSISQCDPGNPDGSCKKMNQFYKRVKDNTIVSHACPYAGATYHGYDGFNYSWTTDKFLRRSVVSSRMACWYDHEGKSIGCENPKDPNSRKVLWVEIQEKAYYYNPESGAYDVLCHDCGTLKTWLRHEEVKW
jgi:hypothetical protein